jgi:ubiquinone/menaquinone biosynthesis C-methylase UbiE
MHFDTDLHDRFVEQASWTRQAQSLFLQAANLKPDSRVLEVGCGTGAVLSSVAAITPARFSGVDIQPDLLRLAHRRSPGLPLACADGYSLPFTTGCFDAVVCHYFLLWVKNVPAILREMRRVTRPGGLVAALAEPDYGSRIDYPDEFSHPGCAQRDALIGQGADPDMGRKLPQALADAGCQNIAFGILGAFQANPPSDNQVLSEMSVLKNDLAGHMYGSAFDSLLHKDERARLNNTRVQFIPTFFAWGYNLPV